MKHKSMLYKDKAIINYQDEGCGEETLVLLHGFMHSLDVWASYVFKYMKDIRIIAIDLLGHGESTDLADVHTMDMQADMVKAVLDHIGVRDCVIAGHSMGGYISLALAQRYPEIIKGLALINSHALKDTQEGSKGRLRTCEIIERNRASFIVSFIPELFSETKREELHSEIKDLQDMAMGMKAESIIAAQRGMMEKPSSLHILANADYPILFLAGKHDSRIEMEKVFAQAMMPKHSELMVLDNVGHMVHVEARSIIQHRLLSFTKMCYI